MAVNLTGGTRYVDIPEALVEQDYSTADISWSAWVYLTTSSAAATMFGCHDGVAGLNSTVDFLVDSSSRPYAMIRQDSTPAKRYDVRVNAGLATGQWYHLCYTFDASGPVGVWYVDGEEAAATVVHNAVIDAGLTLAGSPMRIGQRGGDGILTLDGHIEDMRWADRVLASGEVGAMYQRRGRLRMGSTMQLPLAGAEGVALTASDVVDIQGSVVAEAVSTTAPVWSQGPTFGASATRPRRWRS